MISQRFLKEEEEYKKLTENTTNRTFKIPEVFRIVRYLKNIGYTDLMAATNLNKGNLYFILNNPISGDNEQKIYQIHEIVKKAYGLRGCYRSKKDDC